MAGLFGFFNFEKEGPGIYKDAPKKHTFFVFFETFFRNIWKFISINLVYCILCLPVFTNGLANAGITNVTRNTARDKHSFGIPDFFETIKKNLKQSLIAGIINTFVYALVILNTWFYFAYAKSFLQIIGLAFSFAVLFVFTVMQYYIWTLMITFDYTIKQIYSNSFKFVFVNLWKNLIVFFTNILIIVINILLLIISNKFSYGVLFFELIIFVFTYPCFNALLIQFCTFPSIKKYIIDPYYQEHPDADLDKRRDLGIEIAAAENTTTLSDDEDDDDDNGVIFAD